MLNCWHHCTALPESEFILQEICRIQKELHVLFGDSWVHGVLPTQYFFLSRGLHVADVTMDVEFVTNVCVVVFLLFSYFKI